MQENDPDVSLRTVHDALKAGFGEVRAGFADLKATMIAGFGNLPTRESSEAMVQLLQWVMLEKGMHEGIANARFEPLATGLPLTWKYRGQVLPETLANPLGGDHARGIAALQGEVEKGGQAIER